MAKRLYDVLSSCKKEEEVKEQFVKFFKIKLNALKQIDHYSEEILYEFKLNKNFRNIHNIATVIAQTMYYARALKYGKIPNPLSPIICIVDKDEAFFFETKKFQKFYSSEKYDWDRCASYPDPKLVVAIEQFDLIRDIHIYNFSNPQEELSFIEHQREFATKQLKLFADLDKKSINEDNFLDVYKLWFELFGEYVKNGRKPSEYFLADIEEQKSFAVNNQIGFDFGNGDARLKQLPQSEYQYFWNIYEKVKSKDIPAIRQKADRISEDYERRFTGEFYTPIEFAEKGVKYLEKTIGKEWWKTGEYRFWDMAAGTGNLEFMLPEDALQYCYISTLLEDDAKYCNRIFPKATCFQYDYLNDDVGFLNNHLNFGFTYKMPEKLVKDLQNPKLKWIIFINPPFATSNTVGKEAGKKSKDNVSMTQIRTLMNQEDLGEASRELFTQFLYRINKEFSGKDTHLCLYSTLKYINAKNDKKTRDNFFHYKFQKGFIFSIQHFGGANGHFPVGFLIWDLSKRKELAKQKIILDVFNENFEKIGVKQIYDTENNIPITEWIDRPKNTHVMPPFKSAISFAGDNKDVRDRVAEGFLCSLSNKGNDFQNQNSCFLLSAPYVSAGAFSVTPDNFEKSMVLHIVKKLPQATWTNNRDQFFAPIKKLSETFISDCVLWSAFADSNNCVSLKNIKYKGEVYQIQNNLYPYLLKDVKKWDCSLSDFVLQISSANENRFLARWISEHPLSKDAQELYDYGKILYKYFYKELCNTHWKKFKIDNWDVGFWQIKQALKEAFLGGDELENLRRIHKQLGEKILSKIYEYGFIYQDVQYFKEEL